MTTTTARSRVFAPLLGAIAFLVFYLAVGPVSDALARLPLPLPGASPAEAHAYVTESAAAVVATGILQLLSVAGLALFVGATARRTPAGTLRRTFLVLGWAAVLSMVVSSAVVFALAAVAPTISPETLVAWRQVSFYAGGVVHVMALGGLALTIALNRRWTRAVRITAWIAAVPALLSVASLLWYYASVLLPAGRLLAMIALTVAGVSILRDRSLALAPAGFR